jgi:hypothetical protein
MLSYSALFLLDYPPLAGIEDEVGFINQALVWSRGAISAEGAGYTDLGDFVELGGRHVSRRHPGRSLLVLPFVLAGGVRAVFASGLVLHLGMTATGAALLVRLGKSPLWASLLLFHPTLAVYSRTVMADEAAGTGLLVAAWFTTVPGVAGTIGAGLAVGLGAVTRYHVGLALPFFVAAIARDRDRPRRGRDGLLCLLAGSLVGLLIVFYNVSVYGTMLDPFGSLGYYSPTFLLPHALFYATALMVIWPGMLLAPLFDRTRLRWFVRGVCCLYLTPLLFYYFHDVGSSWRETIVVGQRLLQVALPLWVVSYAVVLDDWVVTPLGRLLGDRRLAALVAVSCVGLVAADGWIFHRHQEHLNRLLAARAATMAAIPDGSLVVDAGALRKLFGVPVDMPRYRWHGLGSLSADQTADHAGLIAQERSPWFLAILSKSVGQPLPDAAQTLIDHYSMSPVPTRVPGLAIYVGAGGLQLTRGRR